MPELSVLGSLNVDLVTRIDAFPAAGETKAASSFAIHPGGKGANQAVAAGKLGAPVKMFGAIGDDPLARELRASLESASVDIGNVEVCEGVATGTASIWVDARGENAIAIAAGANARVDEAYVDAHHDLLAQSGYILLQGEIPISTMAHLLRTLDEDAARVVLDPAPVFSLQDFPTERIWLLTPNEHELEEISGVDTSTEEGVREACAFVHERFSIARVVCKAGGRGAYFSARDTFEHVPGYRVEVVDTTAAGDAFNGALATALAEGAGFVDAIGFANAVGALAVTGEGAQPALPTREAVDRFLS